MVKYADESQNSPDYNTFYATDATLSEKHPVMTVIYGYSLPSSLSEGGIYSLENAGSGSLATVHNGTDANYTNIYQYNTPTADRTASQKFKLERVSETGGYRFRAMCSSNGTNRVIDIQRNGDYPYPENGGNAYLYTATAPKTQEWLIIGVGINEFKIVLRNDMTLALTAYPSSANGTSSGKSSTSPGNIFLATYSESNAYQRWRFIDEDGQHADSGTQSLKNGVYYFNNSYYGKYLHKNGTRLSPNAASGLLDNLLDTVQWRVYHIEDGEYTIQPREDFSKYLGMTLSNLTITNNTASADGTIPDNLRWYIEPASGGRLIRNVGTGRYLYQNGESSVSSTSDTEPPAVDSYDKCVWRVANTENYGNTSAHVQRELASSFSIPDMALTVGESKSPTVNKSPSKAIWANPSDFTFEYESGSASSFSINQSEHTISAICYGDAKIKVTHKVTGMVKYFDLAIRHENPYTDLLVSNFDFNDEDAILITRLYSAIRTFNDDLSVIDSSWRFARLIGSFDYDEDFNGNGAIAWNQIAGNPVDVYEDNSRVSVQTYITKYLGFTDSEYNALKLAIKNQHTSSGNSKKYGDFSHMQISLAARLAYYLNKTGLIGNLGSLANSDISYLAGWLGDATIDEKNKGLSFNNDDYIADLDAENIYRIIITFPEDGITQSMLEYYDILKDEVYGNRAEIFQRHIPYETVLELIYEELFPIDCTPENCWFFISTDEYYLPVYNFLQSLIHNSANMED